MKTNEVEIRRQARDLIRSHGKNAKQIAQRKMMALMRKDDPKAASVWLAVMYEIHRTEEEEHTH